MAIKYDGYNNQIILEEDTYIVRQSSGEISLGSSSNNVKIADYLDLQEITKPSNPELGRGRLFLKDDNGSTALFILDSYGVERNISIDVDDPLSYKGAIDCALNPNYPAADSGHTYRVSVAGKIGGASGPNVEVGDMLICHVNSSDSGDHATVGANWNIIQANLDGAVIGPASATDNAIARFDDVTGKLIQNSSATIDDSGSINIPSGQKYKINNVNLSASDVGAAATSHTHGNLSSDGKVGSTANLPLITGTDGLIQASSFGTAANTFCVGNDSRLSDARTPTSHTHGNITNTGGIGSDANIPIITGTFGILKAGSFGTAAGTFCEGNDSRLSDARTPTAHTLVGHTASGLTTGHFLKATGATTYAFAAHGLTYTDVGAAATSHAHGSITSAGAIGSTANLVVVTGTSGIITTASRSGIDSRSTFPAASHTHPVSNISDSTTVGQNFVKLTNPSAIRFVRINADNTVSALTAADFKTAIDVINGISSSTDEAIVRWDGITGKVVQNSTSTMDDSGNTKIGGSIGIGGFAHSANAKMTFGTYYDTGGTNLASAIRFYESGTTVYGMGITGGTLNICANQTSGKLDFYVGTANDSPSFRMRISAGGNVGIGTILATTAPTSLLTLGNPGTKAGDIALAGATSGTCTIRVAAAAGTSTIFQLPANNGTNGQFLQTNGSGITTWATPTDTTYTEISEANIINSTSSTVGLITGRRMSYAMSKVNTSLDTSLANQTASGTTMVGTAGVALAAGEICYLNSSGQFVKAQGSSEALASGMIAIATAAISSSASGTFLLRGLYRNDSWTSFTVGSKIYISAATAGAMTGTAPSATGNVVRIVGHAQAAKVLYFNPDNTFVELS